MAPVEGTNSGTVDLTTPNYAFKCAMCHPGGGPLERDRNDNFLYEKSKEEIQAIFDSGKIPGDYALWSTKDKKFIPYAWKVDVGNQTINNTMAPACFLCHSKLDTIRIHKGILNFRISVAKLHYLAGADTAASGLAQLNMKTKEFTYNGTLDVDNSTGGIQINHNVIGKSNDQHCSQCHGGGWDDINEDGKINPMDFVLQTKDPKFVQPDFMKEAKVWFFNENFTDENGIPKNVEVHQWADYVGANNVKGCVDCHQPINHDYIGEGYFPNTTVLAPSHDFAKGNAGPAHGVMWHQMAGSAKCENCHTDPVSIHESVMGPAAKTHMDKIACTTCHIGKKYFYRVKLIDWTLPLWVVSGNNTSITFNGLDKNGYLYGDPSNGTWPDVAWFPQRDFKTGNVTWKLKSVNAMGVLYFEDDSQGKFRPVFARYLAKAFRLNPNLPTKYIIAQIDPTTGKPVRTGDKGYILMKVKKNSTVANDTDLQSGNWTLWRALPNYIDVNLNGQYDEVVDVQIKDDTGLYKNAPDGTPEINTKEEVEAAIQTLTKIISKATGKSDVTVKLAASSDAFAMTHNIRPASEALKCGDCHGRSENVLAGEFLTRTTPIYFTYDSDVLSAPYFDKKVDQNPTELSFAEHVKEELIEMGYGAEAPQEGNQTITSNVVPEVEIQVNDGSAVITVNNKTIKVQTDNATVESQLPDKTIVSEIAKEKRISKVIAYLQVKPTSSQFTVKFTDLSSDEVEKATVVTDKGSVISIDRDTNKGIITALISTEEKRATNEPITVVLGEPSTTSKIGGGGGCSLSTAPGLGGALSGLLGLLPLVGLRRKGRK
ncbi:MAG: hypothetical protein DSZ26_01040 [Thermovibrio sp.]|nr:MAG: hypothetical protein DSZ26_01040 [Thermovibrio sp.]